MAVPGGGGGRLPVCIEPDVWREEVERYGTRSPARVAAERERRELERVGVRRDELQRCDAEGPDGTQLGGLLKIYIPIRDAPASMRPFGFVFAPMPSEEGITLLLVAYGDRHPRRPTRTVYERAHKRLYRRYPDQ